MFAKAPITIRLILTSIAITCASMHDECALGQSETLLAIRKDSKALRILVHSKLARTWLDQASALPDIPARIVYRDETTKTYYSSKQVEGFDSLRRAALKQITLDERFYYYTKYGSPLAYARPLEILGTNGVSSLKGKRILDFGYGGIGHLRMLASMGAEVVGVDVDSILKAVYDDPCDTGVIKSVSGAPGRIMLVEGRFPSTEEVKSAVGGGFDLVISKNTLKRGYIHPERPADKRMLIDLGVSDEEFVRAVYRILKPGGRALIYNLCPAPAPPDKPYIPWADGRCPFPKELWENAGFKVLGYDVNDDPSARGMGHALGWDQGEGGMKLETDLFGWYTLITKPR